MPAVVVVDGNTATNENKAGTHAVYTWEMPLQILSFVIMNVRPLTQLYDLLSSKFGKEAAENLTCFIGRLIKWIFASGLTLALMVPGLYLKK